MPTTGFTTKGFVLGDQGIGTTKPGLQPRGTTRPGFDFHEMVTKGVFELTGLAIAQVWISSGCQEVGAIVVLAVSVRVDRARAGVRRVMVNSYSCG